VIDDLGCCAITTECEVKIQYWRQYQGCMPRLSEIATNARQFSSMQRGGSSSSNWKLKNFMKIQKSIKTALMVYALALCSLMTGMLTHQIEFSKAIQEIYKPISGRASDPNSAKPEGNTEGIKACEEYEAAVQDLQE